MDFIEFKGNPTFGGGSFKRMIIPGRLLIEDAPNDWPLNFHCGSFNVKVTEFPPELERLGNGIGVNKLDNKN